MRIRTSLALCLLLTLGTAALAQNKIDTTWHCLKPTNVQKLDVGDEPDHSYLIQQGNCTATSSKTGQKSGTFTEFMRPGKIRSRFMDAITRPPITET